MRLQSYKDYQNKKITANYLNRPTLIIWLAVYVLLGRAVTEYR